MKVFDFPKISRARMQVVDAESKVIGDGSTNDPTEEERAWLDAMKSNAPELAIKQKRLSVCSLTDIVEYNNDAVVFKYDGIAYTIKKPTNSLQIARAREYSVINALEALNVQRCIVVGAVPIAKDFSNVSVETIRLLSDITERFFFASYL